MKLKRRGVMSRYGDQVEAMYGGGGTEIIAAATASAAT
jgi:hypothetical protein